MEKFGSMNFEHNILIASPYTNSSSMYYQSVIYICEHNNDGAWGVFINKPAINLRNKIFNNKDQSCSIHMGGLNQFFENNFVIYISNNKIWPDSRLIANNVFITNNQNAINFFTNQKSHRQKQSSIKENYKIFSGYLSWDENQLENEIMNNLWICSNYSEKILFSQDTKTIWSDAWSAAGIRAMQISNHNVYI